MTNFTADEIEQQIHDTLIRKEQMQELCKVHDDRIFDIIYNVTEAYVRKWSPSKADYMQKVAIEGKRLNVNPSSTSWQKADNFKRMYNELDEQYNAVILMQLDELKKKKKDY